MTIVWILVGSLLVLIGSVFVLGTLLPRDHVAVASTTVPKPAEEVWNLIRRPGDAPSWRPSIKKIEPIEGPADAPTAWIEHSSSGKLKFNVVRDDPPRLLETRIDDSGLPFGGSWTFELTPDGAGTKVRITERGFIKLPPFRVIAKFFMGYHGSIRTYLTDLSKKCGGNSAITNE